MNTPTHRCIYSTRTNRLIDFVFAGEADEEAIRRLAEYGPDLVVLDLKEAAKREDDAHRTEPAEISAERFQEMLGILPPVGWRITGNGESFKISEPLTGNIHSIFVKLNERHFTFDDCITLKHDEICAKVFHSEAYRQAVSQPAHAAGDLER